MSNSKPNSDSFELYDLRVEVVCSPNERILCGAKNGDHFTLQGELLYLPPGQGFSIYSLCTPPFHFGSPTNPVYIQAFRLPIQILVPLSEYENTLRKLLVLTGI